MTKSDTNNVIVKTASLLVQAEQIDCVESVRIRSYSDPYFPVFGLNTERYGVFSQMREKKDQNNSEYGHISRSDKYP